MSSAMAEGERAQRRVRVQKNRDELQKALMQEQGSIAQTASRRSDLKAGVGGSDLSAASAAADKPHKPNGHRNSIYHCPLPSLEASKEGSLRHCWTWNNHLWKRWSHERVDGVHQETGKQVYVRPPKQPWTLKPLKCQTDSPTNFSRQEDRHEDLVKAGPQSKFPKRSGSLIQLFPISDIQQNEANQSEMHVVNDKSKEKFFGRIHTINKALLIASADPMGDCSWSLPYPKAYEILPEILASAGDWVSFKLIMTDLVFLWRKLQGGNPISLLCQYEKASLALFARGLHSERLEEFSDFFVDHVRHLSENPNMIWSIAAGSRNEYVKREVSELLANTERFIEDLSKKLENQNRRLSLILGSSRVMPSSNFGRIKPLTRQDCNLLYSCLHMLDSKERLHDFERCGLVNCLSEATRQKIHNVVHELVHDIQTKKAKLRDIGLETFSVETASILDTSSGKDEHKFNQFVSIWSKMDIAYANVGIYIPPRVWNDEKKKADLEDTLCKQVATAANTDLGLVDLVHISCNADEAKTGMHGKALLRLFGNVPGVEVTVVRGKYWPSVSDSTNKANIVVGIKLQAGKRKKDSAKSKMTYNGHKMQESQQFTRSRPGEMNPMHPRFENEKFKVMVYLPNQFLVITAYDEDKGIRTPIGEVMLKIDDVLSECRGNEALGFERCYGMFKVGSAKPVFFKKQQPQGRTQNEETTEARQSEIVIQLKSFTLATQHGMSKLSDCVMKEANDSSSPLRLGCIVTGPAFDEGRSWETLSIYVCCNASEFQQERAFLDRFVFPALACKCQNLKIYFKSIDMSEYSDRHIVKRLQAIHQCKIRSYDSKAQSQDAHLVLCLLGEKRGRELDEKDINRLRAAETVPGMYDWIIESAMKGMSVLEMELQAAVFNSPGQSEPIFCFRSPDFLNSQELVDNVPKLVRTRYVEANVVSKAKMLDLKNKVNTEFPHGIIRYEPTFDRFIPVGPRTSPVGPSTSNSPLADCSTLESPLPHIDTHGLTSMASKEPGDAQVGGLAHFAAPAVAVVWGKKLLRKARNTLDHKIDGKVCLGHLEEFGLQVYERIWDIICTRYSYARSRTRIDVYSEEVQAQAEQVRAFYRGQLRVPGGTQEDLVQKLHDVSDFVHTEYGDVTYLLGSQGCGKSSILAHLIVDKGLVDVPEDKMESRIENEENTKAVKGYMHSLLHASRALSASESDPLRGVTNEDKISTTKWTRVHKVVSASILLDKKPDAHEVNRETKNSSYVWDRASHDKSELRSEKSSDEGEISTHAVPSKVNKGMLKRVIDSVHNAILGEVPASELFFRLKPPLCVYFIKRPAHSTWHLIAHLCSSLLGHQCEAPSWRRLEEILRHITSPSGLSDKEALSVLFILDGIDKAERDEFRRLALVFQGRVRMIISLDATKIQGSRQNRHGFFGSCYEGLRKSVTTITVPPLAYVERKQVLDNLIHRVGLKKKPKNLGVITDRQAAGSPRYLKTVAGYFASCLALTTTPKNLELLDNNASDIILNHVLPMVEQIVGAKNLCNLVECLMVNPRGCDLKDLRAMMRGLDLDIADGNIRLAMEAFRPFADAVSALSHDYIAITRSYVLDAFKRRYRETDGTQAQFNSTLDAMKNAVEKQDARIMLMSRHVDMTEPEDVVDHDEGGWFSEEENSDWITSHDAMAMVVDEISLQFGKNSLLVDRILFFNSCQNNASSIGSSSSSMDFAELKLMLEVFDILPKYVSISQVAAAFKFANSASAHKQSGSKDANSHELNFEEFLHCMQKLHDSYLSSIQSMKQLGKREDSLKDMTLMVQAAHRGNLDRKKVQRIKREKPDKANLKEIRSYTQREIELIIKVQARARALHLRAFLLKLAKIRSELNAKAKQKRLAGAKTVKSKIKAYERKEGPVAVIQQRLMACFDSVVDAFVYADLDGNDRISQYEFKTAMRKLFMNGNGIDEQTVSKVAVMIAGADKFIDPHEFFRTFAWHNIGRVEEAFQDAKMSKSCIVARVKERLTTFFGRTSSTDSQI